MPPNKGPDDTRKKWHPNQKTPEKMAPDNGARRHQNKWQQKFGQKTPQNTSYTENDIGREKKANLSPKLNLNYLLLKVVETYIVW